MNSSGGDDVNYNDDNAKQNTNILGRKTHKYRKRGRNKYMDPLLIVNKMEKARARKEKTKPNYLPIPPQILAKLNEEKSNKDRKKKQIKKIENACKFKQKKRNNNIIDNIDDGKNINYRNGINKTAYLYPNSLDLNDTTSFINKYGKYLKLNLTLYPKYLNIIMNDGKKRFNICKSRTFKIINQYYTNENESHQQIDPYEYIDNDYILISKYNNKQIKVSSNAYKHKDKRIRNNNLSLTYFKNKIMRCCGGKKAMIFTNYRCINICHNNNNNNNYTFCALPPSQYCIQCNLSLQAIPLFCIGEAIVFCKQSNKKYKVYIYIIALLCENYPICTFPRSRNGFDKYWVKCAWYNDINGKEFNERYNHQRTSQTHKFTQPPIKKQKFSTQSFGNDLLNLPVI